METLRVICDNKIPTKLKQILIYVYTHIYFMVVELRLKKTREKRLQ